MPYVNRVYRKSIDEVLNPLIEHLLEFEEEQIDGLMNYTITRLVRSQYKPYSYRTLNAATGMLECVKLELYRRIVSPYEDTKIKENGDLE